jgi:hypothetical protein
VIFLVVADAFVIDNPNITSNRNPTHLYFELGVTVRICITHLDILLISQSGLGGGFPPPPML